MNWIRLLSQIFFCVLVTSATGTLMFGVWLLCRRFLEKWNPKLVYYMLRWVVIMHLLPITYVALITHYEMGYVQQGEGIWKMLFVMKVNHPLFYILAFAWFVVTMRVCFSLLRGWRKNRRICKNSFDDGDSLAQIEFERIKEALEIKRNVEFLRNDHPGLQSPFVRRVRKPQVILPYLNYSKEELDAILYHELSHIKRGDVLFRGVATFVMVINSWNYATYKLWENVLLWSEATCDAMALDGLEKEGIEVRRYYEIIGGLLIEDSSKREIFNFPKLLDEKESMERRIDIMKNYRFGMSRVAKNATTALILVFAMVSCMFAGRVGVWAAEVNDSALQSTQKVAQEGEFAEESGWSEEMYVPVNDIVDIVYINDGIMMLGSGTLDWNVPVGTRYVTSSLYFTEGTQVQIACTATPSSNTYWFGIMNANSDCYVVEGSGQGSHAFTVPSTGWYYVMVENRSSSTIHVVGAYQY